MIATDIIVDESFASRSITCLPSEILDYIGRYSRTHEQKQLRLVNHSFSQLVTPHLFQAIHLTQAKHDHQLSPAIVPCEYFVKHLESLSQTPSKTQIARHVKSIKVQHSFVSIQMVHQLLRACPCASTLILPSELLTTAWDELDLPDTTFNPSLSRRQNNSLSAQLELLLSGRPGISVLMLTGYVKRPRLRAFNGPLPHLSHIRSLHVNTTVHVTDLQRHCPLLETLVCEYISDNYRIAERWLEEKTRTGDADTLLRPWLSLTKLSAGIVAPTQSTLARFIVYLCAKFPSLLTLSVQVDYTGTSNQALDYPQLIPIAFQRPLSLTVTSDSRTYDCLGIFRHYANDITALDFCTSHREVDISYILGSFPSLQRLRIFESDELVFHRDHCDLSTHPLQLLEIGQSGRVLSKKNGDILDIVSALCPSLQHVDIVADDWICPAALMDRTRLLGHTATFDIEGPLTHTTAIPHSNLSYLGLSYSQQYNLEKPILFVLASLSSVTKAPTKDKTVIHRAWFTRGISNSQPFKLHPWITNMPASIEALCDKEPHELDACMADLVAGPVKSLHSVSIVFAHSLPKRFFVQSVNVPLH
ncbi:hypothetical protein DM01DRAFT_1337680 [Hesseltinella vesiculosa]|uniref:Uncharacterized protein n=1 Tax=Hesseltinella vesiculosa TaxID=101127 RepID=A0A1X2GC87_9FUNG|nr:hypothetical protein DM01DRAFT_1337680 [Hesseltinella vesiculosa]